jgi:hypothetical protein
MSQARTIIIGDVHGCIIELKDLLNKVAFRKNYDRVILVGDLVGKGPASAQVVRYARTEVFFVRACVPWMYRSSGI